MNENELESGIEAETQSEPGLAMDGALALDLEPEITREQRRSRRKRDVRARTISVKRMTKRELEIGRLLFPETDYWKPQSRAECAEGPRPCPFVSCKHHLFIDVSPRTGAIKLNFPDLEVWDLGESCALDVADRGGTTLEDVGAIMNLTRERIRQVEVKALAKLEALQDMYALRDYVEEGPVGKRRLPTLTKEELAGKSKAKVKAKVEVVVELDDEDEDEFDKDDDFDSEETDAAEAVEAAEAV
jgi:Sigma-70, region 4